MERSKVKNQHAPHDCPSCGGAAYVGFSSVECTRHRCGHFHLETAIQWALEKAKKAKAEAKPKSEPQELLKVTIDRSAGDPGFGKPLVYRDSDDIKGEFKL